MAFTYSKTELIQDLQAVLAKHNVQSIEVKESGILFQVEADGSLKVGARATIKAFPTEPGKKAGQRFKVLKGGK
ncbi:hypothetical protein [Halobacillus yeomjeoni]|uniref:Uncharacterized protein n=1 Tax=Halobacillus yeomjeoni TaxID=311194 RepID=A0A931HTK5_9BACI|nr:hypothetical protein [Halobacillus yeomjeoni]MBH0229114.1 hypothetical protein [Halobacillus yeomjeoni]